MLIVLKVLLKGRLLCLSGIYPTCVVFRDQMNDILPTDVPWVSLTH